MTRVVLILLTIGIVAAQGIDKLPVQKVVLFKNGVGYFEHTGRVHDNQDVTIAFTSSQLNDVLKSLTVLDLNGGRIGGVAYGSAEPIDRQIGDLRLGTGEKTTLAEFLSALRGARVELRSGAKVVSGRILTVEKKQKFASSNIAQQTDEVTLVTSTGDVATMELSPAVNVRLLEADLTNKVSRFLDLSASSREPDVRRMVIASEGTGERGIFVSYISEVPVWKTTYRVVLDAKHEKNKPLLQGWAIVDNTVGEDWRNVELSLVAGAPQSFIQNLSHPYYARRPTVAIQEGVNLTPQTFEPTLFTNPAAGLTIYEQMGLASKTERFARTDSRAVGGGGDFEHLEQYAKLAKPPSYRIQPVANAQALGDLFEYKIKQPITIPKNRSALVPILQSSVEAEKVSIWNDQTGINRLRRALWLTNTSGLTLDSGSLSVLEDETFAGEGLIDPVQPGEKRLISYAIDLAVTGSVKGSADRQRVTKVRIHKGVITQTSEVREQKTYTFRNEDTKPRMIVVEHPVREGYQLGGVAKPDETTSSWLRFRVAVGPRETKALVIEETKPERAEYELSNLTTEQVALFVQERSIDRRIEQVLRKLLDQQSVIAQLDEQKDSKEEEQKGIFEDQQRLRENLKALKGSVEEKALVQRYTRQLDGQETRLEQIKKEVESLRVTQAAEQAKLDRMIQEVSFEVEI